MRSILRLVWRAAGPLRRALAARFDQHLDRHFRSWLARVEQGQADQKAISEDMQLVADAMVRELVRLQLHVQSLQKTVETLADRDGDRHDLAHRRLVA